MAGDGEGACVGVDVVQVPLEVRDGTLAATGGCVEDLPDCGDVLDGLLGHVLGAELGTEPVC